MRLHNFKSFLKLVLRFDQGTKFKLCVFFAGEMFVKDAEDILANAAGEVETFMVQSMMFPLMAWECGRNFIVNQGFQHDHLLKHFSGLLSRPKLYAFGRSFIQCHLFVHF